MSSLNVNMPDWLAAQVKTLAEEDRVSVDQFVTVALAEKLSALKTAAYLEERAKRGDREKFLPALRKAPDVPAEPGDEVE